MEQSSARHVSINKKSDFCDMTWKMGFLRNMIARLLRKQGAKLRASRFKKRPRTRIMRATCIDEKTLLILYHCTISV
jgi:hypothetical protein